MREELRQAKRVIVKVGTSSLTHANGRINIDKIEVLVRQICNLANAGKEMILVSSGALWDKASCYICMKNYSLNMDIR